MPSLESIPVLIATAALLGLGAHGVSALTRRWYQMPLTSSDLRATWLGGLLLLGLLQVGADIVNGSIAVGAVLLLAFLRKRDEWRRHKARGSEQA